MNKHFDMFLKLNIFLMFEKNINKNLKKKCMIFLLKKINKQFYQ